jgi:hypothetical protein
MTGVDHSTTSMNYRFKYVKYFNLHREVVIVLLAGLSVF